MLEFEGKTVLITGAAVGIGRACAILFSQRGANVILADVDGKTLKETEAELEGGNSLSMICDVSDGDAVTACVKAATDKFGRIDVLVNNAALWRDFTPFCESGEALWQKYISVNVLGTMNFTKAVLGPMTENGYGRIINVASVAGVYGNANMVTYSTTKGAVISFTKALAKEVTKYGITVNAVSPGSVSPSDRKDMDYHQPSELSFAGRTGTGRENAELICFLASDKAAYISGQNIQIDGCRRKM